jgi:hypothetical protein
MRYSPFHYSKKVCLQAVQKDPRSIPAPISTRCSETIDGSTVLTMGGVAIS